MQLEKIKAANPDIRFQEGIKRSFDLFFSLAGLVVFLPVFFMAAVTIKLDGGGAVFFRQERVGRNFKPFWLYKFRSMRSSSTGGPLVTVGGDKRVTRAGGILRKYKIDELPQLVNVFKGEMSFVGPRPEIKKYVELFRPQYERLLTVRPGLTDPASIRYADEERILARSANWEECYITRVLPEKIRLSSEYVDGSKNLFNDLMLIIRTFSRIGGKVNVFQIIKKRSGHGAA
ncbi:MAG: sugar transferase [Nitrospiraceae bacterium]|nr:sugar transferase [Nitrospiraceae bacterium]